jgi:hypothetical protein
MLDVRETFYALRLIYANARTRGAVPRAAFSSMSVPTVRQFSLGACPEIRWLLVLLVRLDWRCSRWR